MGGTVSAFQWPGRFGHEIYQIGLPAGIGLGKYLLQMCFDGGEAYPETISRLLWRLTLRDMLEHLALRGSQSIEFGKGLHRRRRGRCGILNDDGRSARQCCQRITAVTPFKRQDGCDQARPG